jgi:RNA polymerase sigma factor (sigma-70 family)
MASVLAPARPDRAFERLYRRHVADVYRYVLAVLQNEADAEDATQSAFLSAYRAYERGERPERPLNWLIAIAHNVCRQRWRESARRPRVVALEDEVPARAGAEESANAEEIRRALGYLAFNQRAALVMRELQGRSYGEIAGILGISTSAVETLLFRARRAMREQLEGGLSCGEAELALSKRADGQLPFAERGPLRAHLRECAECAALERRQRFRKGALKSLGTIPLPSSLGSFFGGTVTGTGAGVGAKAAAVVVAGVLGSGISGDMVEGPRQAVREPALAASAASSPDVSRATSPRARTVRRTSLRASRAEVDRRGRARAAATRWRRSGVLPAATTSTAAPSAAAPSAPADPAAPPEGAGASPNPPGPTDAPASGDPPTAGDPPLGAPAPRTVVPPAPEAPPLPTPVPPEPPAPVVPPAPERVAPVEDAPKRPDLDRPPPKPPDLPELPRLPDLPDLPGLSDLPGSVLELPEGARPELPRRSPAPQP